MSDNRYIKAVAAASASRSTATILKTAQTVSYRTGDDGDIEAGRATSFLLLDSAPTHNSGSATLNTTTNRFTDELGGQTYTNNIVLDWSTWNGATLLGYYRVVAASKIWTAAVDYYPTLTIAGFTNWRLPNINEMKNLQYFGTGATRWNDYTPMNVSGAGSSMWCSTTKPSNSNLSFYFNDFNIINEVKAASVFSIGCRTFSLSTSNVLS